MPSLYPSDIDTGATLNNNRATNDPIPASDHNDLANAILALEAKLGIGTGLPTVSGQTLVSTGPGVTAWSSSNQGTAASAGSVSRTINQTAHGFSVGQIVAFNGNSFSLSRADAATGAEVTGIVSAVNGANSFILVTEGYVTGLSGLTTGTVYFLSPTAYGLLTSTEPTTTGQISKPVFIADGSTSGYFHNYRGIVVGSGTGGGNSGGSGGTGSQLLTVRRVTASTTMTNSDDVLYVVNGGITVTLQPSQTAPVKRYSINNRSNQTIQLTAGSGNDIDGIQSAPLMPGNSATMVPYTTTWILI